MISTYFVIVGISAHPWTMMWKTPGSWKPGIGRKTPIQPGFQSFSCYYVYKYNTYCNTKPRSRFGSKTPRFVQPRWRNLVQLVTKREAIKWGVSLRFLS